MRAAEHEQIVAVKDAKGDLSAASWVMRRTDLAWYSGEDVLNLPLLSIGGVGFVSVAGHLVAARLLRHARRLREPVTSTTATRAARRSAAGLHRNLPHPGSHDRQGRT